VFTDAENAEQGHFLTVFGKFDPLHVVGHRADPQKAFRVI